jgi:hypothetical protein
VRDGAAEDESILYSKVVSIRERRGGKEKNARLFALLAIGKKQHPS